MNAIKNLQRKRGPGMMSNKLQFIKIALTCVFVVGGAQLIAAENDVAEKTEVTEKKKKKGPTKKPEYFRWKDAAAVAEAWEQPVVVFVDLEDCKVCSRVRAGTVGNRFFKDFVKDNCVYYRYKVPRVEVKRGRRNRGSVNKKDDLPKPDFEAVKESEKRIVDMAIEGKSASRFPKILLLKSNGQKIGTVSYDSSEPSFEAFIGELKGLFESAKYDFAVPRNIQKLFDAEAKKRAALEKRKKK